MRRLTILIFALLLWAPIALHATGWTDTNDDDDPEYSGRHKRQERQERQIPARDVKPPVRIEQFLAQVGKGQTAQAIADFTTNSWIPRDKDKLIELKNRIEEALIVMPGDQGQEQLESQEKGSVSRYLYLLKRNDRALLWEFVFYKGENGWVLAHMDFTDQLQNAFH